MKPEIVTVCVHSMLNSIGLIRLRTVNRQASGADMDDGNIKVEMLLY